MLSRDIKKNIGIEINITIQSIEKFGDKNKIK